MAAQAPRDQRQPEALAQAHLQEPAVEVQDLELLAPETVVRELAVPQLVVPEAVVRVALVREHQDHLRAHPPDHLHLQ
jgi:hypothetical protein